MAWLRPALRLGRAGSARERTWFLDHAGQGESHAMRGAHDGLRTGDGQRRRHWLRWLGGQRLNHSAHVFKPIMIFNFLNSARLLADACRTFTVHCVKGLGANRERIEDYVKHCLMLVMALNPKIGYDNAAKIAKTALRSEER